MFICLLFSAEEMISYDEAFALSLSFNLWSCMDILHGFPPTAAKCSRMKQGGVMQGRATETKNTENYCPLTM